MPSTIIDSNDPVHDFQNLVEFVETYMSTSLALFNDYASDNLTNITFDNLWMLFDIGDLIYCPLKKGGQKSESLGGCILVERNTVKPPLPSDTKYSSLLVFCFYLDYEFGKILIRNDAIRFPPFDGEVEITSLEAYPLRYRRQSVASCEDLVAQGLTFVDLMLPRHRKYDGLTASAKAEEVYHPSPPYKKVMKFTYIV